ncbi:transposase [Patescibacteria group bacterium AH-259-L05]|nr:transposase [Patescibacteria group bacterium AH-259-L05]
MRKTKFANKHFYHVYNRGVEKRDIFLSEKNYVRFIHDLYEFNSVDPAQKFTAKIGVPISDNFENKEINRLVNIVCFCLMPNHFHLILEQLNDGGITQFMQKLGIGYVYYFNLKYERVGPLFQGRYKAIHIDNENYLLHLSRYIHLNPVELVESKWKEQGITNWENVNEFLEQYRWSSYLDYIGKKNFPSVIHNDIIRYYFGSLEEDYKGFVNNWLTQSMNRIEKLVLEK